MTKLVWEVIENRRNEALDIRNYAIAAGILIEGSQEIEMVEDTGEV